MMKKFILSLMSIMLPMIANADAIEIDGIYYNVITKAKVAEVVANPNKYKGIVNIPESVTNEGIEYSVTSIADNAFYGCSELLSVTIPDGLTTIGVSAFRDCNSLQSINIPNSVTTIYGAAFRGCCGLTAIDFNANITRIEVDTFYGCSSLLSICIPNSVTYIGITAFYDCTNLKSIIWGNGVNYIANNAFLKCNSLEKIIVSDLAAWCSISFQTQGSNPLYCAKHLFSNESTEITDLVIPDGVTELVDYSFIGCSGITSLTIPKGVSKIGECAFQDCSGLKYITLSGSVSINKKAFANCPEISEIYCYSKTPPYAYTSYSLVGYNSNVFENSQIEYAKLYVPASSIESYKSQVPWSKFGAIAPWDYIDGIYYNFIDDKAEVTYLDEKFNSYSGEVVIPASVTTVWGNTYTVNIIGDNAFKNCSNLTSVTIPNSITTMGSAVFSGCI